jgi:DNA-directed RNA polymerase subunit RPC12/RpoP
MKDSADFRLERSIVAMKCLRCRAELIPMPEPEDGDWIIRCLECGVKNLVTLGLRTVAWKF